MSASAIRKNLHLAIDNIKDESFLNAMYTIVSAKNVDNHIDLWDTLSKQEKAAIEKGLKDIEEGNVFSHESVRKAIKTRYKI